MKYLWFFCLQILYVFSLHSMNTKHSLLEAIKSSDVSDVRDILAFSPHDLNWSFYNQEANEIAALRKKQSRELNLQNIAGGIAGLVSALCLLWKDCTNIDEAKLTCGAAGGVAVASIGLIYKGVTHYGDRYYAALAVQKLLENRSNEQNHIQK